MQMENKKDKTEPNRSIKAEARTNTDDKAARPMTMREKVEAYKAGTF